jgi:hypothetical protein
MNNIRISCASLCRIRLENKYLLSFNKNRGDILTPIGGALEFEEAARPYLKALKSEFQDGMDLRLLLPIVKVPDFEMWFKSRRNREITPCRELIEELRDEHHLAIPGSTLMKAKTDYLGCLIMEENSTRRGQEGVLTRYYFEAFDVELTHEANALIIADITSPGSRLHLASTEEIVSGRTLSGIPIGRNSMSLFEAKRPVI